MQLHPLYPSIPWPVPLTHRNTAKAQISHLIDQRGFFPHTRLLKADPRFGAPLLQNEIPDAND